MIGPGPGSRGGTCGMMNDNNMGPDRSAAEERHTQVKPKSRHLTHTATTRTEDTIKKQVPY